MGSGLTCSGVQPKLLEPVVAAGDAAGRVALGAKEHSRSTRKEVGWAEGWDSIMVRLCRLASASLKGAVHDGEAAWAGASL
jgi:hypothetical protein